MSHHGEVTLPRELAEKCLRAMEQQHPIPKQRSIQCALDILELLRILR